MFDHTGKRTFRKLFVASRDEKHHQSGPCGSAILDRLNRDRKTPYVIRQDADKQLCQLPGIWGGKGKFRAFGAAAAASQSWHESTESNRVLRNRSTSAQNGSMLVSERSYGIAPGKSRCCRSAQDANRHRGIQHSTVDF